MYYIYLIINNPKTLQALQCCNAMLQYTIAKYVFKIYKELQESLITLAAQIWFLIKHFHSSYIDMGFLHNVSSEEVFKCLLRLLFSLHWQHPQRNFLVLGLLAFTKRCVLKCLATMATLVWLFPKVYIQMTFNMTIICEILHLYHNGMTSHQVILSDAL